MANKAIFEIIVTDKGLKVSQKNVEALGASVEKTTQKTRDADKASTDYYSKQNKGIIGTANSSRSFSKLAETIGGDNAGLVGAYAALAANAFAVSAAFSALNNAAQATALLQGLEAQGARTGRTLSTLSANLRQITKDSISSTDAMRATAQASTAGISSTDLEKLTKVAYEASLALGRDVPDSLNRMILAVTKIEPELVDELGLTTKITEASEKYARQNNITVGSMTQMQKQQALLNSWVEQGTVKFGGLAEEVSPNPYNQLAATFDNLVKSGLGIINVFLSPLISMLAASQTILLGFATVFISSIKGQIIPGLQDASASALKASEANKKAAIKELEGQKSLSAGKRKAINEYISAAKEGVATQDQYSAAITESNNRETKSSRFSAATQARIQTEEIGRRKELASIQKLQSKVILEEAKAQGYAASEGVSFSNSKQKLKDTMNALSTSFTANYNAARTSETGLKGLENRAVATGKGIAAAGKVAAIGFLNFLPVIGIVIAAVSVLWELVGRDVFYFLTGQTKESVKAFEDFNTVLDSTSKKIEGLKKIEASTANAADRAVAAIKNQTATIYELADAYVKLYGTRKKSEEEPAAAKDLPSKKLELQRELAEASKSGDTTRFKEIQSQQALLNTALKLGVSDTTSAAQAFQSEAQGLFVSTEAQAAVQYLDNLEQQLPRVAEAFYASYGGAKAFNKLDTEKKLEAIAKQAGITSISLKKIESSFDSLSKSIGNINTGYTDFIKSITPTTAYDVILDKFKSFKSSLREVNSAISESGSVGVYTDDLNKRLSDVLTGFKGESRNIFTLDVQANLSAFDEVDSKLQDLIARKKGLNEEDAGYKKVVSDITELEARRSAIQTQITPQITKQVQDYNKLLVNAQIQSVVAQGNLAIAQAQLNVIQKQGIITAADVERQMRAENSIIALQAEQLKIQKTFLDIDLQKQKNRLQELEDTLELLKSLKDITAEKQKANIVEKISILQTQIKADSQDPKKTKDVATATEQISTLERSIVDSAKEEQRIRDKLSDIQDDINLKQAASVSLGKQISAILMASNSKAEIAAAKAKKRIENEKQFADIIASTEEIYTSISSMERDIVNSLSKGTNELDNQLRNLKDQSDIKREQFERESKFRKDTLIADLNLAKNRGNTSQIEYYSTLIELEDKRTAASLLQVDAELNKNTIQAVALKNIEEEISLQKKSLELREKILDATNQNSKADFDYMTSVVSLERKRAGAVDTDASRQMDAIMAAEFAYDLAAKEATIKKALIELEFKLLAAQRVQSIDDLNKRAGVLREQQARLAEEEADSRPKAGSSTAAAVLPGDIVVEGKVSKLPSVLAGENAKILEDTARSLGGVTGTSIEKAGALAIQAIDLQLKTLGNKLEESLIPGTRVTNGIAAQFQVTKDALDLFDKRKSQAEKLAANDNTNDDIPDPSKVALATDIIKGHVDSVRTSLEALGPGGTVILAAMDAATHISNSFQDAFKVMSTAGTSAEERVVAVAQAISAVIGGIQSITTAASEARIAAIDKEISAEQKRDGKSSASVAKLEALEKKKEAIAKKQFNLNKKLMIAQAVMSTAAGVAGALAASATIGPIAAAVMAGVIGAMGIAQIALIAGTSYESAGTAKAVSTPSSLSIGKRSDTVDLARGPNANAGGEAGYLRGSQGTGSNASNYRTTGSAYGGELMRGYGNRGFVVGEKGPEVITPETPITVTPANDVGQAQSINASFNIQAIDSSGVQDILVAQKGNIISMLREAANASGSTFLENVNTNVYTRPGVSRL
jgi:hypothetical protein